MFNKKLTIINALIFVVAFTFIFIYSANPCYACDCARPGFPKEELSHNSAVFSGKVIDIEDENGNKAFHSSDDPITVLFEVKESWKGNNKSQVVIHTVKDSASCGFEFALNEEYIVYANEQDGEYHVSLCSRTALLSDAGQDLTELGKGEEPTEMVTIDLGSEESKGRVAFILLTCLLIAVVTVIIMRRLKKK